VRPRRVLFIGNSFTARNDVPGLLRALCNPEPLETSTVFAGGASLRRHWNGSVARQAIDARPWDRVVLQEQSTLPVKNAQRFQENVRLFDAAIRENGAVTTLYLTWSRRHAPESQQLLTQSTLGIADELGASVVPVGIAWHDALRRDPALRLYDDDGSHPTVTGSYLAACVFLATLFDAAPATFAVADRLGIPRGAAEVVHQAASAVRDTRT
jgi:hypothetical protein